MIYDKKFFEQPLNRFGTDCVKWDMARDLVEGELNPMWVADMDFPCAPEITESIINRAMHPCYGYTVFSDKCFESMSGFMKRRHGITIEKDKYCLLPCVITGLRAAVQTFTEPGDKIIIQTPLYGPFFASVQETGRTLAQCRMKQDASGRYTMDLDAIENACRSGAKMMLLCNPHNPVGRAWSAEELEALTEVLARYGVMLVSDEIHEDFVYKPLRFAPACRASRDGCKVISLSSISKTFNLAGLQQAFAYSADAELISLMKDNMAHMGVVQGNIFAMTATETAYRCGDAWLDGVMDYMAEGAVILRAELKEKLPEAVMSPLEATFLAWVNIKAYGLANEEVMRRCRKYGAEFNDGTIFGKEEGEGYLRVNIACPHERIRSAVCALAAALKNK